MRIAPSLQVTETERQQLAQWARGRRTPARLVLRAKIALLAAAGHDNQHIAAALGTSRQTVGLWRRRFAAQRLPGLAQDAPRGGRPPKARQALTARILKTTTQTRPPAATHWSTRTLARHLCQGSPKCPQFGSSKSPHPGYVVVASSIRTSPAFSFSLSR